MAINANDIKKHAHIKQERPTGPATSADRYFYDAGFEAGRLAGIKITLDEWAKSEPPVLAKQEQGEPVALKKGECWPEEVMRQWDYWRKEIANGHKGSAPRDWFEGLSELKLIDTTPQQRKPLTFEQIFAIGKELGLKCRLGGNPNIDIDYARAIEAAHGIKGEA